MFTVKLKTKGASVVSYANEAIIIPENEVADKFGLDFFLMTERQAKKLATAILIERPNGIDLDYISIVEMTNYKPLRPYQVVFYQEFK